MEPDSARFVLLVSAVAAVMDAVGVATTAEARLQALTALRAEFRANSGPEFGIRANRGPDSALSAELAAPITFFAPSSAHSAFKVELM
ncbi:hypothetical protein MMPV_009305 [Pyropia vietnamensis]